MSLRLLRLAQHLRASSSHAPLAKKASLTAATKSAIAHPDPIRLYTASSAARRPIMSDEAEKAKLVRRLGCGIAACRHVHSAQRHPPDHPNPLIDQTRKHTNNNRRPQLRSKRPRRTPAPSRFSTRSRARRSPPRSSTRMTPASPSTTCLRRCVCLDCM